MLIKPILSRLIIGAALVVGGVALPALAHAHDRYDDNREYWHHHDHHRPYWNHGYTRYERDCPPPVRIYERRYIQPNAYYVPSYQYRQPREGLTIVYRDRW